MEFDIDINSYIGYPISSEYIRSLLKEQNGKELRVRICSLGGDVVTALDIYSMFKNHGNVTVYIQGMTASAATVIAMGARRVVMDKHALLLVHNTMASIDILDYKNKEEINALIEDLRSRARDAETIDNLLTVLYSERAGSDYESIKSLMGENRWISSEEALSFGLIDEINETDEPTQKTALHNLYTGERMHFAALSLPEIPTDVIASSTTNRSDIVSFSEKLRKIFTGKNNQSHSAAHVQFDYNSEEFKSALNEAVSKAAIDAVYNDVLNRGYVTREELQMMHSSSDEEESPSYLSSVQIDNERSSDVPTLKDRLELIKSIL